MKGELPRGTISVLEVTSNRPISAIPEALMATRPVMVSPAENPVPMMLPVTPGGVPWLPFSASQPVEANADPEASNAQSVAMARTETPTTAPVAFTPVRTVRIATPDYNAMP